MMNAQLRRETRATGRKPSADALSARRVLVVIDDSWRRWMMCGWLSCLGANVRQAGGCAEALELLAEARFDLVVSDVRTSVPDAIWLVATMRYLELETPCIVFDDVRPELEIGGAALVVRTPLNLPVLARYARRALAMRFRDARKHHRP